MKAYETKGLGVPVRRDPSGRPYWLAHEAHAGALVARPVKVTAVTDDARIEQLRRSSRRGHRAA